jgi:hypothetical protein
VDVAVVGKRNVRLYEKVREDVANQSLGRVK